MAEHDDLDDILDSALDDFRNVDGLHPNQRVAETAPSQEYLANSSATSTSSGKATTGQGLGLGLPALAPGKRKTNSTKGKAVNAGNTSSTNGTHLSDTLEELAQQTRQTLEGLGTPPDDEAMAEKLVESLVKQFEELGGSQDMHSIMDTMMRQLLSKDVLQEPMKEIGQRYPHWLEANKAKLSTEDYSRYSRQYELIKQLCRVYETNPEDFPRIVEIMQNMQECGQPPSEIVQELAPGLELGADGLPMLSELLQDGDAGAAQNPNCSVM